MKISVKAEKSKLYLLIDRIRSSEAYQFRKTESGNVIRTKDSGCTRIVNLLSR